LSGPFPHRSALLLVAVLAALAAPGAPRRESGEREHAPSDWFAAQRGLSDDPLAQAHFEAARQRLQMDRALHFDARAGLPVWQPVGPYNVGGRVTALAVGRSGIYLGAANGGVWKSTNGGVSWACITDATGLSSIGSLAVDPAHPETLYCGTGEANSSGDSYDGNGLWRSMDGGATWASLGLAATGRIARVVVDPQNPLHVLVAAQGRLFSTSSQRGVYRTLDGGTTWNRVLFVNDSTGVNDLVVNPVNPDTMFCSTWERVRRTSYRHAAGPGSGLWRSVDRGATWAQLTSGLPPSDDNLGRIALAIAPSRPSTIYAQIGSGPSTGYVGLGFFRSTDGGTTWSQRDAGTTFRDTFGGFVWYFGDMAVDPANPDHVYALGVDLIQSLDAGVTWGQLGGVGHPDQHALWIDPANSQHVLLGNDGGFWSTTDGSSWTPAASLPITQFYAGDVDPTNAAITFGGTQDNYTLKSASGPSGWNMILDGDGFYPLVDPVTPNVVFCEWQNCCSGAGFRRSISGGPGGAVTSGWNANDRYNWCTPIAMNPRNHNTLIAGSQYLYRSTDNGRNWSRPSGLDLSTNPAAGLVFGTITTLAISAADTSVYYAGTDDGRVWRSGNLGVSWTEISAGLPGRWVTRVTPDPADAQVVYVTQSGTLSDIAGALVFRSANQGGTWASVGDNLPAVPANDLVVDPTDTAVLFVGTDLGVWWSRDRGGSWAEVGAGLPVQVVSDLTLHAASRQLFAWTHGRSAWKLDLTTLPSSTPPPTAPTRLALTAPWPNPAHDTVRMSLDLPRDARVEVAIYDCVGRRVSTLLEGAIAAGTHPLVWDRRGADGRLAASGVYFVRAVSGGATSSRRIALAD
jgi:photosystem II stability/assembly factor-like uncharacterized protein